MRKIIIELQVDWEGYEDVSDELIVEDAIEVRLDGVGWTLLRQPLVSGSLPCHHNYIQKDTYWKSCTHCGMIAPLRQ